MIAHTPYHNLNYENNSVTPLPLVKVSICAFPHVPPLQILFSGTVEICKELLNDG